MLMRPEINPELFDSLLQFTISAKERIRITSRPHQSTLFKLLYAICYLHHLKVQAVLY
jgi:hypothetical protein